MCTQKQHAVSKLVSHYPPSARRLLEYGYVPYIQCQRATGAMGTWHAETGYPGGTGDDNTEGF